jgi:hypothetical protein
MSDFLSNLVDRALDRAPLLERRRPARFEPARERIGAGISVFGDAGTRREEVAGSHREGEEPNESRTADGRTITPPPASPWGSRLEPVEVRTTQGNDPSSQRTLPTAPAKSLEPVPNGLARLGQTDQRDSREEIFRTRLIETIVERKIEQQPSTGSTPEVERNNDTPRPPSVPATPMRPQIMRAIEREPPNLPRSLGTGKARAPSVPGPAKPVPSPQPAAAAHAQPRMTHSPRPAPGEHQRPSAPPAVQVTIVRLEIRAVSPAAGPPRRTRAATPKLSLEAYLLSRNGGPK